MIPVPRAYYFVAPRGVGPEGLRLLENPEELRAGLISRWDKSDLIRIRGAEITLHGELREYVEALDFSIIKDVPPSKIIDEHRETRHPPARFGGGLVRLPPDTANVPTEVAKDESRFVEQLLEAYGDHLAKSLSMDELKDHPNLKKHFDRQRKHFYLAELLRNFTRDNIPEDRCFERLQDAIYDGVIDIAESDHNDGFERVKKTIAAARNRTPHPPACSRRAGGLSPVIPTRPAGVGAMVRRGPKGLSQSNVRQNATVCIRGEQGSKSTPSCAAQGKNCWLEAIQSATETRPAAERAAAQSSVSFAGRIGWRRSMS